MTDGADKDHGQGACGCAATTEAQPHRDNQLPPAKEASIARRFEVLARVQALLKTLNDRRGRNGAESRAEL